MEGVRFQLPPSNRQYIGTARRSLRMRNSLFRRGTIYHPARKGRSMNARQRRMMSFRSTKKVSLRVQRDGKDAERERRVAAYREQVQKHGRIVVWVS